MLRDFPTLHSISLGMSSLAVFQACLASRLAKRCCSICSGLLVRLLFLFNLLARLKKKYLPFVVSCCHFPGIADFTKASQKDLVIYIHEGRLYLSGVNFPEPP